MSSEFLLFVVVLAIGVVVVVVVAVVVARVARVALSARRFLVFLVVVVLGIIWILVALCCYACCLDCSQLLIFEQFWLPKPCQNVSGTHVRQNPGSESVFGASGARFWRPGGPKKTLGRARERQEARNPQGQSPNTTAAQELKLGGRISQGHAPQNRPPR